MRLTIYNRIKTLSTLLLICCCLLLQGCYSLQKKNLIANDVPFWEGRIAIKTSQPKNSNNLAFELQGSEQQGELTLFTPVGIKVAQISWQADLATLNDGKQLLQYADLSDLLQTNLGVGFSAAALFDWLNGKQATVADWDADLSQQAKGKIKLTQQGSAPASMVLLFKKISGFADDAVTPD